MATSHRRFAAPLLVLFFCAAPAFADSGAASDKPILAAQLPVATDQQFEQLVNAAMGSRTRVKAVNLTQTMFCSATQDPKQFPQDVPFDPKDVANVGTNVAQVLDYVEAYQKTVADAKTVARDGDPVTAKAMLAKASTTLQTNVGTKSFQLRALDLKSGSSEGGKGGDASPVTGSQNGAAGAPPTAPPSVDLGQFVTKIAEKADAQAQAVGNGGAPGGPNTPAAPGGGAAPNGAPPLKIPTIGEVLGVDDPNNPQDAMADARQRFDSGDIAGGLADATRAVNLGGGADALAMRAGMQLDQKNYVQAYQDASQALQIDPKNQEAIAIAHLSRTKAASGGSAAGDSFGGGASDPSGAEMGAGSIAAILSATRAQIQGKDSADGIRNAIHLGDMERALALANGALVSNPNDPNVLALRAGIYLRKSDYKNALEDAEAGLKLAPGNHPLLVLKSRAQLRSGRYKDALDTANEILSSNPNDANSLALRGHAYGSLGDHGAMMADLNRAAALNPYYQATAAQMAALTQLPDDKDFLFLFPGEQAPAAGGRGRRLGLIIGVSVLSGLLLAMGLLKAVMAPSRKTTTAISTRAARTAGAADTARPAPIGGLLPPPIRGQYEILRQIGEGGMGMVFEAKDRSLGRRVAIKKMREEIRNNPRERQRFVIEAKTVAALRHPTIVDIYAIVEDGLDVYLVFEYVDGSTVHDLIQRAGRLPIPEAARISRAAADALGHAHSRGVVHRDMKPSNVMLDASGRVKVMDFGIARMAKDAATRYSMTNTVVGTPPYMAPEQEQGHVRRESDVYALAVCAYEMLTGKLPFSGVSAGMLMNKINMSFVPPSRATAGLPETLDLVFARAFQADPERRYRTPKDFSDALEAALPAAARS